MYLALMAPAASFLTAFLDNILSSFSPRRPLLLQIPRYLTKNRQQNAPSCKVPQRSLRSK